MTRVIAGTARGRRLTTLAGHDVRPTTDRVKEAMFSIVMAHVPGARVLDLCAGSGALGIEALSRGAAHCHLVERHPKACEVIRSNLELTGFASQATVIQSDAGKAIQALAAQEPGATTLIVGDPPYKDTELSVRLLSAVGAENLCEAGVHVLLEVSSELAEIQEIKGLDFIQCRKYGSTRLLQYRTAPEH